jgi:hypothetical protein
VLRGLFWVFEGIFRWLEGVLEAVAAFLETKRRCYTETRDKRYIYRSASAAPGWTACGGRAGTNE